MTYTLPRSERDRLSTALAAAYAGPTDAELEAAPLLEHWITAAYFLNGRPVLVGDVSGHPELPAVVINTSTVVLIDYDKKFARTQSRWYRLGTPAKDVAPELMSEEMRLAFQEVVPETPEAFEQMILDERAMLEDALKRAPADA